jgi:hypothetical protein
MYGLHLHYLFSPLSLPQLPLRGSRSLVFVTLATLVTPSPRYCRCAHSLINLNLFTYLDSNSTTRYDIINNKTQNR